MPHLNVDPVVCAAAMIQSLQTVVSRNVNPMEAGILSINMIEGGSPVNLVVDQVRMKATVRSLSEMVLDRMIERVETIVERTSQAYECRSEILWKERVPAVWNSPEMTEEATEKDHYSSPPSEISLIASSCMVISLNFASWASLSERTCGLWT